MFEKGFDIDAVIKRLRSDFKVEAHLPFQIRLMLAHLMRAQDELAATEPGQRFALCGGEV